MNASLERLKRLASEGDEEALDALDRLQDRRGDPTLEEAFRRYVTVFLNGLPEILEKIQEEQKRQQQLYAMVEEASRSVWETHCSQSSYVRVHPKVHQTMSKNPSLQQEMNPMLAWKAQTLEWLQGKRKRMQRRALFR